MFRLHFHGCVAFVAASDPFRRLRANHYISFVVSAEFVNRSTQVDVEPVKKYNLVRLTSTS